VSLVVDKRSPESNESEEPRGNMGKDDAPDHTVNFIGRIASAKQKEKMKSKARRHGSTDNSSH